MMNFTSLFSSSSGNCLFVTDGKTKILIDCGVSGKQAANSLKEIGVDIDSIDAILVTHEHIDHIKGIGILSRRFDIPIYAKCATWEAMKSDVGKIQESNVKVIDNPEFSIGELFVTAIDLPHDAADPCGYSFASKNKRITIVTDIGHMSPLILQKISGSDFVFLEANHDVAMLRTSSYPEQTKRRILGDFGHLSNENAGFAASSLISKGAIQIMLGHLSSENNYPKLAYDTVANSCEFFGMILDKDYVLSVAPKCNPSKSIAI